MIDVFGRLRSAVARLLVYLLYGYVTSKQMELSDFELQHEGGLIYSSGS